MKKYLIGNWKSNKNRSEAQSFFEEFSRSISEFPPEVEVVIAPSFPLLDVSAKFLNGTGIKIGIQDLSQFEAGSYTGAVSVRNLQDFSVDYAILGHSERRRYFRETNNDVAGKVSQALSAGITPIVCVDKEYVDSQAAAIADEYLSKCLVAYEPVAAIGTFNNVDVGEVKVVKEAIKNAFGEAPVLYGGSVNSQNVAEYTLVCDGVLVGGASLDVGEFISLIKKAV